MLERIKEFFTGGQEVSLARTVASNLERRENLSPRDRRRLEGTRQVSRRHFLKLLGVGTATTMTVAFGVIGVQEAIEYFLHPKPRDTTSRGEGASIDLEKAAQIRAGIRQYEQEHFNVVNKETLTYLAESIAQLYGVTFGRTTRSSLLVAADNEQLKQLGMPEVEVPRGDASLAIGDSSNKQTSLMTPIIIFLGPQETNDNSINKLSVVRGLIMHEFIHTQAEVIIAQESVSIGDLKFKSLNRKGLKWNINKPVEDTDKDTRGWLFNEANVQMLAEYLNDPSGQDDLFTRMMNSPVYRYSLSPRYTWTLKLLKDLYGNLGISMNDIEDYHFRSQPREFLDRIDHIISQRGIILPKPTSATLIELPSLDPQSNEGLESLKEVIERIV